MNLVQPWMLAASALGGAGVGAAIASTWWVRKLQVSRALIDQLQTSRRQLEAQVGVARRQIKQLQMEMSELRLAIERMRRQSRFSTSLAATTDRGEPLLSPMSACTPLPAVSAARFSSVGDAAMAAPAVRAWDAERIERARERVAVGGFCSTEPMERRVAPTESATASPPIPFGFLPTQPHPRP
ncbi:hypothetical protein [Roseateles sp.]|uniref:hypothetical protein n=1 Tax=Roseateles sp. TaxID=1971397 RepID=UPI0031E1A532